MNLSVLWDDQAPPVEAAAKKQAMSIPVSGVNQGKPYPPAGGAKELPPPNAPRPVEPPAPRGAARGRAVAGRRRAPPAPPARAVMETLPAPPPLETHGEWLRAYQEAQRQTAEAHAAYQRAMAESHMAFLRTAETSFAGLSALLGGQPVATAPSTITQQPAGAVVAPALVASPVVAPRFCRAGEHADRVASRAARRAASVREAGARAAGRRRSRRSRRAPRSSPAAAARPISRR